MSVRSVSALVECRYVGGQHFLDPVRQLTILEMQAVGHLHHLSQEFGVATEALQDFGHRLTSGVGLSPLVVYRLRFTRRLIVFNPVDTCHDCSPEAKKPVLDSMNCGDEPGVIVSGARRTCDAAARAEPLDGPVAAQSPWILPSFPHVGLSGGRSPGAGS